jgi:hypothetical protein
VAVVGAASVPPQVPSEGIVEQVMLVVEQPAVVVMVAVEEVEVERVAVGAALVAQAA